MIDNTNNMAINSALFLVDIQNDFCPGGALSVPEGDQVIPAMLPWLDYALEHDCLVVASRDWHPKNHCSFESQGGPWPEHCVEHSWGAAFHPDFVVPNEAVIVNKATQSDQESYSAMSGVVDATGQLIATVLQQRAISDIYVCGLALDYCVFATAKQAVDDGYRVHIILPACRGIDKLQSQGCLRALQEQGVHIIETIDAECDRAPAMV